MSRTHRNLAPALLAVLMAGLVTTAQAQTGEVKMTGARKTTTPPPAPGKIETITFKNSKIVFKPYGGNNPIFAKTTRADAVITISGQPPCAYRFTDGVRSGTSVIAGNTLTIGAYFPQPGTYKVTVTGAKTEPAAPPCLGEAEATVIVYEADK